MKKNKVKMTASESIFPWNELPPELMAKIIEYAIILAPPAESKKKSDERVMEQGLGLDSETQPRVKINKKSKKERDNKMLEGGVGVGVKNETHPKVEIDKKTFYKLNLLAKGTYQLIGNVIEHNKDIADAIARLKHAAEGKKRYSPEQVEEFERTFKERNKINDEIKIDIFEEVPMLLEANHAAVLKGQLLKKKAHYRYISVAVSMAFCVAIGYVGGLISMMVSQSPSLNQGLILFGITASAIIAIVMLLTVSCHNFRSSKQKISDFFSSNSQRNGESQENNNTLAHQGAGEHAPLLTEVPAATV